MSATTYKCGQCGRPNDEVSYRCEHHPKPAGLEELYTQLDAAIDAACVLVTTAQAVLPDDVSAEAFRALQSLAALKLAVNPGPTEEDPF